MQSGEWLRYTETANPIIPALFLWERAVAAGGRR